MTKHVASFERVGKRMNERRSNKASGRKLILFGLLAIFLMISAGIYAVISARMQLKGTIPSTIVGTWRSVSTEDPHGLGDSIWDLRGDGTARWRLSSGKSLGGAGNTIGYFEWWTEEPNALVTHQYSSEAAAMRARLINAALGAQVGGRTDFELVELSENEFKLRAKVGKGGKEITYRRTNDPTVEAVP